MSLPIAKVVALGIRNPPKCHCGEPFRYLAVTEDEKGIPFFCRNCDAHATGCQAPAHAFGQCVVNA